VNNSRNPKETTRTFLVVRLIIFFILKSCKWFKKKEFLQLMCHVLKRNVTKLIWTVVHYTNIARLNIL